MSLTVISPRSRPSASTTGSFSILLRREDLARPRSSVVPTGAVTRSRDVMSADTGWSTSCSKRRSRFVRMPTSTPSRVGDRDAGDLVVRHERERVADEGVGRKRDGLDDHARLRALHLVDLGRLVVDREVAVDDADAALARERDREARLGDGVHRRGDDRDAELDRPRQARAGRHVVRQHARLGGHEEDVVEGEPFLRELPVQGDESLQLVLAEFDAQGMPNVPPAPDDPTRS